MQARLLVEMRRAEQFALEVIGPAVQGADDVLPVAAAIEHDGLAVAAHVGHQLDAGGIAHQHAALVLGLERVVVADLGNHQFVADVARTLPEQQFQFLLVQRFVEVDADGQLRISRRQLKRGAEIGHYPHSQMNR
ncbi:hypothetical protein D9M69_668550 [compost metagenome]